MLASVRAALTVAVSLALLAAAVAGGGTRAGHAPARAQGADVFTGLATWVDIYDGPILARAETWAARLAARGVRTVFLETANDRSTVDVVDPDGVGRFLEALHGRGIAVVGWNLPGFDRPARDLRRTRAMLGFRSPGGETFDAVGLDIESLRVKNVARRTRRLLELAQTLDLEAGETPVGAIVYPPRALERHAGWWPGFPWAELTPLFDAFVVMAYTGGGFPGYDATYGYVARSLELVRREIGVELPLHVAGGVANRMTVEELTAFTDAVADDGTVLGWSLYDLQTTKPAGWSAISSLGG
jgi:hypothetical protein